MVKVSVIIAMYNEEEYIWRCIESFLNQTYTDFELILIDDGSADKTIQKAETYIDKLPLKILQQQYDESGKKIRHNSHNFRRFWKNFDSRSDKRLRAESCSSTWKGWLSAKGLKLGYLEICLMYFFIMKTNRKTLDGIEVNP